MFGPLRWLVSTILSEFCFFCGKVPFEHSWNRRFFHLFCCTWRASKIGGWQAFWISLKISQHYDLKKGTRENHISHGGSVKNWCKRERNKKKIIRGNSSFELSIISQNRWVTSSITWLECTTRRAINDSRTLAHLSRAKCIAALSLGNSIHSIYGCSIDRQWTRYMDLHHVSFESSVFSFVNSVSDVWLYEHIDDGRSISNRSKPLRTPSNVFVINLALCDFVMMMKTPIFIYNSFNHGYALGSAGCQIFALMGSLSGIGAAITNACIAYDRFAAFNFF